MKGIYLVKTGSVENAFEVRETEKPTLKPNEVLVKVEAFGLNYADVLARKGIYPDAPPLPAILGYDSVGRIEAIGDDVTSIEVGKRVLAFTKFGSYAEYVVTEDLAVAEIPEDMDSGAVVALGTQYTTAYYGAYEMVNLHEKDKVLILSAAGGVGTALIQMAKANGCTVIAGIGSNTKKKYVEDLGADYVIDYGSQPIDRALEKVLGKERVDVIFDPIGGSTFKKALSKLNYGGKIVNYGAASRSGKGLISILKLLFGFGFYTPIKFLMKSQSLIGLNMLRVADHRKHVLAQCLKNVIQLYADGVLQPHVGGRYKANEIATAHAFLESRKSKGKIVVEW